MTRYTDDMRSFILDNVKGNTLRELTRMFNERFGTQVSEGQMKSYKVNHKLRSDTPRAIRKDSPSRQYPQEIRDYIFGNYVGCGPKDMADRLNRTFGTSYTREQLKGYYANHGLNSGTTSRFQKGHVPFTKGKHIGELIRDPVALENFRRHQFGKGNRPKNWSPVGTERRRKGCDEYVYVKVAEPNVWEQKQRVVWRQIHGDIPEGMMVSFLDGDRTNFSPENLFLITNQENGHLGATHARTSDADITKGRVLVYRLEQRIREVSDEGDDGRPKPDPV